MKNKPLCASVLPWLKANLGPQCLGCLTGQTGRALAATVQVIGLYSYCDEEAEPHVLAAFREIVNTMDGPSRELAYHSIAHVLDWGDRARVWDRAGLAPLQNPSRCAFE